MSKGEQLMHKINSLIKDYIKVLEDEKYIVDEDEYSEYIAFENLGVELDAVMDEKLQESEEEVDD